MSFFKKFLNKIHKRGEEGFTVIEAVISVPLVALIASTLFFFMNKSVLIMRDNAQAMNAASEVQSVFDDFRDTVNCQQLNEKVNEVKSYNIDNSKPFTIESKYVTPALYTEDYFCNPNGYGTLGLTIESKAIDSKTGRVIFKSEAAAPDFEDY